MLLQVSRLTRITRDVWFHRTIVVVVLFVLPFSYLIKQALFDAHIEFLPPSLQAEWVLHPAQDILSFRGGKVSLDVVFARDFPTPPDTSKELVLRARAFGQMRVLINGIELEPMQIGQNWKYWNQFDLTPHLRASSNQFRIHVHNPGALPALSIKSPVFLRTPDGWKAAIEPKFDDFQPVVKPLNRPISPGPLQRWAGWSWMKWLVVLWLAGIGSITLWLIFAQIFRLPKSSGQSPVIPKWAARGVPLLIFTVCLSLNLFNAWQYPYSRSEFDWSGHVSYVKRVAQTWLPPVATDGWQMFQPPLYYYSSAIVYNACGGDDASPSALKCVQFLGSLAGIGVALLA